MKLGLHRGSFLVTAIQFSTEVKSFAIEQKGMTFDHKFGYSFFLFSSLLKKEGRRKGE